jgi:2,4-dienoyl-CoA reductase-like NADH-dependent reductase (Old Yellow Enzyme family)
MNVLNKFNSALLGPLKNRIVMSAMTRGFADNNHCCTNDIAAYYERRAKDGVALILTEGVVIHSSADGYNNVPHIETEKQTESWKKVVEKVHATDSKIFAQLWHCGRISHSDYCNGEAPVSSTNKPASGINRQNDKPYGVPRALETDEMPRIYDQFVKAAENAFNAGFDGIQIHMGHGYLIDQFFDTRVNDRIDKYGGSIENRCRFALELLEILMNKYGSEKVMVRISPSRFMGELYDWPNLEDMIDYLIPKFDQVGLRLLDISCANADYYETSGRIIRMVRKQWPHFIMGGASLSLEQANEEIENGLVDMITWGRAILSNPDFVKRISNGEELKGLPNDFRTVLY